jgi:hypothetical protein
MAAQKSILVSNKFRLRANLWADPSAETGANLSAQASTHLSADIRSTITKV